MLFVTAISPMMALAGGSDHRADDRAPADRVEPGSVNFGSKLEARDPFGRIR
jgi:hypothetical protein